LEPWGHIWPWALSDEIWYPRARTESWSRASHRCRKRHHSCLGSTERFAHCLVAVLGVLRKQRSWDCCSSCPAGRSSCTLWHRNWKTWHPRRMLMPRLCRSRCWVFCWGCVRWSWGPCCSGGCCCWCCTRIGLGRLPWHGTWRSGVEQPATLWGLLGQRGRWVQPESSTIFRRGSNNSFFHGDGGSVVAPSEEWRDRNRRRSSGVAYRPCLRMSELNDLAGGVRRNYEGN